MAGDCRWYQNRYIKRGQGLLLERRANQAVGADYSSWNNDHVNMQAQLQGVFMTGLPNLHITLKCEERSQLNSQAMET